MLKIHLQGGSSTGIRLFPNYQAELSCYLAAPMGLKRILTLFMDRRIQRDICAELEEETLYITLITAGLSLSGLEVGLFSMPLSKCSVF